MNHMNRLTSTLMVWRTLIMRPWRAWLEYKAYPARLEALKLDLKRARAATVRANSRQLEARQELARVRSLLAGASQEVRKCKEEIASEKWRTSHTKDTLALLQRDHVKCREQCAEALGHLRKWAPRIKDMGEELGDIPTDSMIA